MAKTKPRLRLYAKHLGPIMELDAELTEHKQNLVFARNGSGKSFLARSLRCFDKEHQGHDLSSQPTNIVSEESASGRASLTLSKAEGFEAKINFDREKSEVELLNDDLIFHVFSDEFVSEELRERRFAPDGDITSEIAIDSENIEIQEAEKGLRTSITQAERLAEDLKLAFDKAKESELVEKAGVRKSLKEFVNLKFDALETEDKPDLPKKSFARLLEDLDTLKSIPAEPRYPSQLTWSQVDNLDLESISTSLSKLTSPSIVADEIKSRINSEPEFYKTGVKKLEDTGSSHCPFCEQSFRTETAKELIDGILSYFSDREESHKAELRRHFSRIQQAQQALSDLDTKAIHQSATFDALENQSSLAPE